MYVQSWPKIVEKAAVVLFAFQLFVAMTVLIKFIRTQKKNDIMMTKEPFKEHFSISSIRADQTEKKI